MGSIDVHQERDYYEPYPTPPCGAGSCTSGIEHPEVKQNPIGFIWPKKEEDNEGN